MLYENPLLAEIAIITYCQITHLLPQLILTFELVSLPSLSTLISLLLPYTYFPPLIHCIIYKKV
jgi:hypothetical protein